ERDRKAGLPARQVRPIELVRRPDVGMSGVGAEDPRRVARRLSFGVVELVCLASHRFWPLYRTECTPSAAAGSTAGMPTCARLAGAPPRGLRSFTRPSPRSR